MKSKQRKRERQRKTPRPAPIVTQPEPQRRPLPSWVIPVAIAAVHFIVLIAAYNPAPPTGGDDATYLALAKSLISGHYRDIWDPLTPAHVQYPPIFPLILAGGLELGLTPELGLKILIIVFSAIAIGLSIAWMRKVADAGIAIAVGGILALSPGLATISHAVLSDVPFWAFTMLALLLWQKYSDRTGTGGVESMNDEVAAAVAALATVLANFTRSAGLPLIAAAAVWLLIHRRKKAFIIFLAVVVPPILIWWLRAKQVGHGGYIAPFLARNPYDPSEGTIGLLDLPERISRNLNFYLNRHIPVSITGRQWPGAVLGLPVIVFAAGGWVRRLRKPRIPELWFPLYAGLILVWPATWSSERFILPILPLMLMYGAEMLLWLMRRAAGSVATPVALSTAAILVGLLLPDLSREMKNSAACREQQADLTFSCTDSAYAEFFRLAEMTRGLLPEGSVVLSRKPSIFFIRSGYRSTLYPLSKDVNVFFHVADSVGAKFVVVDQMPGISGYYLHPILLARRDDFCVINELSFPNASLARIDTTLPPRREVTKPNSFRGCPLGRGQPLQQR